ncbi:protein GVQW3 [Trichonephila clavipes]|nr:protein GVQW3 [Trichonephila clavipes]
MAFVEHRMNIKFCVGLGERESATKTYEMLKPVYNSVSLSGTQAFKWYQRFREDRESVEDDGDSGRTKTCRTVENIEKVSVVVREKRLQTIAYSVRISKATCQQILAKDLYMHRVCQHIVPRILN